MLRTTTLVFAGLMIAGCQTDQSPAPAQASVATVNDTFRGTKADVIKLAIRAIQSKGWKLGDVNESVGLVSFETAMSMGSWSGIRATLFLDEIRPGTVRASGSAKQNLQGGQVAAFDIGGEAQGIVKEAVIAMRTLQPL